MNDWHMANRPIPVPDEMSRPFWDSARKGALALQQCENCHRFQHLPYPICVDCKSARLRFTTVEGRGQIYSYTIMYHEGDLRFKEAIPYAVVLVEPDQAKGVLLAGNLLGSDCSEIRIGRKVEVVFEKISDQITLPQFRLLPFG